MRKFYTLLLSLLFVTGAIAQNMPPRYTRSVNSTYHFNKTKNINNKTVNCIDTVRFPYARLSGFEEIDSMEVGYIEGLSQAYHYTGNAFIHGVTAYVLLDLDGIPANQDSISMVISIYSIIESDPTRPNKPQTLIATDTVDVHDVGFQEQALFFKNPVAVSDSFAVVIELNQSQLPPNAPWYGYNKQGDGNQDKLAWAIYAGALYNAYTDWGGAWDSDILLHPIIEQNISASFTTDKDTICLGDTVAFTNGSVNNTDVMFNLFNTTDKPLYTWNFDDGSGEYHPTDTSYDFTSSGYYNTQLKANYYGYSINCMDSAQHLIVLHDTAAANFGFAHQGGGTYQFSDSSSAAYTWSWDFGDSSPLDNSQNPSHTYSSPNNYNVCLTVSDSNGCKMNTYCNTVSFVLGVQGFRDGVTDISIYPIPANQFFNVKVPYGYSGGEIIITDVVGQKIKSIQMEENKKEVKILTNEMSSGVYFVSVDYQGERVFTKRIVVDK
ncbi:MAG: PKD domain-containing protein [Vicingus serpentipes]|nr:PKD domain-containing protein [Vicingus serpentipes]